MERFPYYSPMGSTTANKLITFWRLFFCIDIRMVDDNLTFFIIFVWKYKLFYIYLPTKSAYNRIKLNII